ncbi:hypothetical protein [Fluviispira sanaruensis]|uniref:Uncharacterized protein n=1 Tax=Fluviispira sanaruensis TaxID=2493639 RepID=A0A4P2VKC5_FLUSA|nr:hypothetical protein [Fluviispira sanaruensis]BBH53743.1 hypothetical protein JCM31447_21910 [Fluviispira sanaruensis]
MNITKKVGYILPILLLNSQVNAHVIYCTDEQKRTIFVNKIDNFKTNSRGKYQLKRKKVFFDKNVKINEKNYKYFYAYDNPELKSIADLAQTCSNFIEKCTNKNPKINEPLYLNASSSLCSNLLATSACAVCSTLTVGAAAACLGLCCLAAAEGGGGGCSGGGGDCCNPFSVYTYGGTWHFRDSASIMVTNKKLNLNYICPNQEFKMGWDMDSPTTITTENGHFVIDRNSFSIRDSKKP